MLYRASDPAFGNGVIPRGLFEIEKRRKEEEAEREEEENLSRAQANGEMDDW